MCRDGEGCVYGRPPGEPAQLCEKEIDPKFKVHTQAEALALITSDEAWAFANAGQCTPSSNACLGAQKWVIMKKNGRMFALLYAAKDAEAQAVMLEMLIRAAENRARDLKLNMDYFYRVRRGEADGGAISESGYEPGVCTKCGHTENANGCLCSVRRRSEH